MAGFSSEGGLEGSGAPTMLVLAADDGGDTEAGRGDVSGLVSQVKTAGSPDTLLNAMVKINDALDADEDGLLENPFAKEVRAGKMS